LLLAACRPSGPGYSEHREDFQVRFLAGPPPALEIRVRNYFRNTGGVPLDGADFVMPAAEFPWEDLRVTVNHAAVELPGDIAPGKRVRIPFATPLRPKNIYEVAFYYRLTQVGGRDGAFLSASTFYLPPAGWTPRPVAPEIPNFRVERGPLPIWQLIVYVPPEFRVYAPGQPDPEFSTPYPENLIEYRFNIPVGAPEPGLLGTRFPEASRNVTGGRLTYAAPVAPDALERDATRLAKAIDAIHAALGSRESIGPRTYVLLGPRAETSAQTEYVFVASHPMAFLAPLQTQAQKDFFCAATILLARLWVERAPGPEPAVAPFAQSLSIRLAAHADPSCNSVWKECLARARQARDPESEQRKPLLISLLEEAASAEAVFHSLGRMLQDTRGREWTELDFARAFNAQTAADFESVHRKWSAARRTPARRR
jgi:hypothetical protein